MKQGRAGTMTHDYKRHGTTTLFAALTSSTAPSSSAICSAIAAFHFTPTSASWLNAVEGFFANLTRRRLERGVFRSVVDLQVAINRFVAKINAEPKSFVWTADPKRVLAAVKRGKQALESLH